MFGLLSLLELSTRTFVVDGRWAPMSRAPRVVVEQAVSADDVEREGGDRAGVGVGTGTQPRGCLVERHLQAFGQHTDCDVDVGSSEAKCTLGWSKCRLVEKFGRAATSPTTMSPRVDAAAWAAAICCVVIVPDFWL